MEINFSRIKSKTSKIYLSKLIKSKTSINIPDSFLLLELFIFLIRKKIINDDKITVIRFGTLYVKEFSTKKALRFRTSKKLRSIINRINNNEIKKNTCSNTYNRNRDIFKAVSKCFKLKIENVHFMFNIFIYGIIEILLEEGIIKLENFGFFYLEKVNYQKDNVCGVKRKIERVNKISFRPIPKFQLEVNKNVEEFVINKRLKKVLDLLQISYKI